MNNHNFQLINCDTDAITINKFNNEVFSKEELQNLTAELNGLYPELIRWEFEFNAPCMIILKAKNYILKSEDGKITYKGSALKSSKTEPALKQFLKDIINEILNDTCNYSAVYESYVQKILNITDITPWCTKKSLTSKTLEANDTSKIKVMDAIKDTDYVEGDRLYVFYLPDDTLCLKENFKGEYNRKRLLKRLYDSAKIFNKVIDISMFKNYSLVKNLKELGIYEKKD